MDDPERPRDPAADPAMGTRRRPRTEGDTVAIPEVQFALGLLILFLFLFVVWIVWPLLSRGG